MSGGVVDSTYETTPVQEVAAASPEIEAPAPATPVPVTSMPVAVGTMVVGHAEDRAESDADRMADNALSRLRRLSGDTHLHGPGCDHVRRMPAPASAPVVGYAGGALDAATSTAINRKRGGGRPLADDVRARMEDAFSSSFSGVRIHDDDGAARLNQAVSARAFTTGNDIFFGRGEYAPETAAGERVLAHELAHTKQDSGQAHRLTVLHRLAYNDDPATWKGLAVKRSGEGVKGVFFVGPAMDVVVKPLPSTGTVEFANEFMKEMNLPAPQTVRHAKGTPAAVELGPLLLTATGMRSPKEAQDQIDDASAYLVMEKMGGKSIQTLDDTEAEEFLGNDQALKDTGRIMVADAFLGNGDRLIGGNVNLGNFFYQAATLLTPAVVNTIDNDSKSTKGATRTGNSGKKRLDGDLGSKIDYLEMLMDPTTRPGPIGAFLAKFAQAHKNNPQTIAYLTTNRGAIIASVSKGVEDALKDMATLFETNTELVKSIASGTYDTESGASRNASSAKAAAKYVTSRAGGMSKDEATTKMTKYVEYRAKRDKTPSGFKWVTKLVSDTGF